MSKAFSLNLYTELFEFDILAFSETRLGPQIDTNDLLLQSYNKPERKDRVGGNHGGVMVYVKNGIYYIPRHDLEIRGIWPTIINMFFSDCFTDHLILM